MNYDLYVETGPKQKTTLVHVPALLGCVQHGPTTAEALEATPGAIRAFRCFLARIGQDAGTGAPFTTTIANMDTGGGFIGVARLPTVDFEPVSAGECATLTRRLEAMHAETLALVSGLSREELAVKPAKGRPIGEIVAHILGSDYAYFGLLHLRVPGLHALQARGHGGEADVREVMREGVDMVAGRLRALTDEERTATVEAPSETRTLRLMFRRMLEHGWEHHVEIARRLGREL